MPLEYEIPWGMKEIGGTHFKVNSGIQAWGPPVKTAGASEILFINVSFYSDFNRPKLKPQTRLAAIQ
jgi:hypothetical protein